MQVARKLNRLNKKIHADTSGWNGYYRKAHLYRLIQRQR